MAMKIEKRKTIDDGIFDELAKKHPVKSEKGVCYAQNMDYITLEVEAFNDPILRKLIKQESKVLIVYMYLRERMCHSGWCVSWDNDTKEDIKERLTLWGVSEDESENIVTALIEKQVIRVFVHAGVEFLTDVQQIYNWEMLQAKRARDRKSKQSKSKENGTDSVANVNYPQDPTYPPPGYYEEYCASGDDELPFV